MRAMKRTSCPSGPRAVSSSWAASCTLLLGMAACAAPPPEVPFPGTFLEGDDGAPASFTTVMDDLLTARVVYVGEHHEQRPHHALQGRIIEAVHQRDPSLAVGMEMFQQPFQAPLDAWVGGQLDEAELLEQTEYERRWGYDFAMYRPILEHAREHGIPLVALNAPQELSKEVARHGFEGLSDDTRGALPDMDLTDDAHRALVMDALASHGDLDEAALERFYQAQVLWDETMAEAVARTLSEADGPARMIVMAGAMHVRGGHGIPERAARRGAAPYRIVLPADARDDAEVAGDDPAAHWWWQP